jgi:hypothetical protein
MYLHKNRNNKGNKLKKILLLFLVVNSFGCIYAQENIVFNKLRKLQPNEIFIVEDRLDLENERYFRFTINILNETHTEKVLEFRDTISIYMFNDKKRFLAYLNIADWNNPRPLYYIDGRNATIEYIGSSFGGHFIIEESMVFINIFYENNETWYNELSPNLYVYSILEKKIISTFDTNKFIQNKVNIEDQDNFDIEFVGYLDYRVPVCNGYIKIYFNHFGQNDSKSFFAYLYIKDVYNLKIEENIQVTRE